MWGDKAFGKIFAAIYYIKGIKIGGRTHNISRNYRLSVG